MCLQLDIVVHGNTPVKVDVVSLDHDCSLHYAYCSLLKIAGW